MSNNIGNDMRRTLSKISPKVEQELPAVNEQLPKQDSVVAETSINGGPAKEVHIPKIFLTTGHSVWHLTKYYAN